MTPPLRTGVTIVVLARASVDPNACVFEATRRAIAAPSAVALPEDLTRSRSGSRAFT